MDEQREAVRKMQDYIREHIQEDITINDLAFIGYEWDEENPRIQLEPRGERGYIELVPVKEKI